MNILFTKTENGILSKIEFYESINNWVKILFFKCEITDMNGNSFDFTSLGNFSKSLFIRNLSHYQLTLDFCLKLIEMFDSKSELNVSKLTKLFSESEKLSFYNLLKVLDCNLIPTITFSFSDSLFTNADFVNQILLYKLFKIVPEKLKLSQQELDLFTEQFLEQLHLTLK